MEKPKEIYLASSLNGLYSYALTTLAEYEQKNAVAYVFNFYVMRCNLRNIIFFFPN